jgi:hypothetical protein
MIQLLDVLKALWQEDLVVTITYPLLWLLFWGLPWSRVLQRAGYRGFNRTVLRLLIIFPPLFLPTAIQTSLAFFVWTSALTPFVGIVWLAYTPWPALQKPRTWRPTPTSSEAKPKTRPKAKPKVGELDQLSPHVWVVRCADGAYWMWDEDVERLGLSDVDSQGQIIQFTPARVTIPPSMEGKISGVARKGSAKRIELTE